MKTSQTTNEPRILTTVRLPADLHRSMEALKDEFGIPHNHTIQRGIQLAIRELTPEPKRDGIPQEA